jgi:hypothetical protein
MASALCILLCVTSLHDPAALQALLDRGIPRLPTGVRVVWEHESHAGISGEEMARLSQAVAGKPDHPDRRNVENARRRASSGPDRKRCEVMVDPIGRFRYREIGPGDARLDVVIADGIIWVLSGESLTLLREAATPPPGRNFVPHKANAQRQVAQFTLGALSFLIGSPDPRVLRFEQTGDEWTATVGLRDGLGAFHIEGRNDRSILRARLARLDAFSPSPAEQGAATISADLWADSPIGPVDRLCEEYAPGRVLRFRSRLIDITTWNDSRVFEPPQRDATTEPLRGEMLIREVADFRQDPAGRFWTRDNSGDKWLMTGLPPSDPARVVRSLDRVGYLALAGVVTIFAGVWLRRRFQTSYRRRSP